MFLLTYPHIDHARLHIKTVKMCIADNELLFKDLEPTLLGSCIGPKEAMTDHILGLESKISSLFFFHSLTREHEKRFCIFELATIY